MEVISTFYRYLQVRNVLPQAFSVNVVAEEVLRHPDEGGSLVVAECGEHAADLRGAADAGVGERVRVVGSVGQQRGVDLLGDETGFESHFGFDLQIVVCF